MGTSFELTPDDPVAVAAGRFWAAQLAIVAEHETAVRDEADVTAVHETRKALRRSRAALRLYEPYFTPGALRPIRRRLRKTMRKLGPARDVAVFRARLAAAAETGPPETAVDLCALHDFWAAPQTKANEAASRAIDGRKFLAARRKLAALAADPTRAAVVDGAPAPRIGHVAPLLVFDRLAQVRALGEALAAQPAPRSEALHECRIRFKRLRYTLDALAPLLGEAGDAAESSLNDIQDHLGDLNDAAVALRLLAAHPAAGARAAAGAAHFRALNEAEIAARRQAFGPVWTAFNSPAWRRPLAAALADL